MGFDLQDGACHELSGDCRDEDDRLNSTCCFDCIVKYKLYRDHHNDLIVVRTHDNYYQYELFGINITEDTCQICEKICHTLDIYFCNTCVAEYNKIHNKCSE